MLLALLTVQFRLDETKRKEEDMNRQGNIKLEEDMKESAYVCEKKKGGE